MLVKDHMLQNMNKKLDIGMLEQQFFSERNWKGRINEATASHNAIINNNIIEVEIVAQGKTDTKSMVK
jgi:hypothetical protein